MASDGIVIIATGPLTSDNLSNEILKITGQDKLFFMMQQHQLLKRFNRYEYCILG